MSFSSDVRNAFARLRRPAPDLLPVPKYGDLWLVAMACGHVMFSGAGYSNWLTCSACGAMDAPMISQKVTRG
jgi:hypothetical protein